MDVLPTLFVASIFSILCAVAFLSLVEFLQKNWLKHRRRSTSLEISNSFVSLVHALILTIAGMVIAWETRHDFVHAQHSWASGAMVGSLGYIVYDTWCMYYTYHATLEEVAGAKHESIVTKIWNWARSRPSMVIHHIWYALIGAPSAIWWRRGKASFKVGCMYIQDLSTIFLSIHEILIELGMKGSRLFTINGVVMIVSFFLSRIVMVPWMFYAYARYANIPWYLSPFRIPKICLVSACFIYALEVYWFCLMVKGCVKNFMRRMKSD